jgi:transcriptional regulator of arginine metabolism
MSHTLPSTPLANSRKDVQIGTMNLDEAILSHLSRSEITEQQELLEALRRDGFDLTLSTLSRHFKKLGVRKEEGRYRRATPPAPAAHPFTLLKAPPQILVLRTTPGYAQAMALALDQSKLPSLAGTLAGDDTIFAVPTDAAHLDRLEREIRERLRRGL